LKEKLARWTIRSAKTERQDLRRQDDMKSRKEDFEGDELRICHWKKSEVSP